ncbi:MAG: DivIVA domain-containing protein [Acidimicrobiales bacterium]
MAIDLSPSPRFTLALRGYDKDEVDDYLESLVAHASDSDDALTGARERIRQLDAEVERLSARVGELEEAARHEPPYTVRAIGERITLILEEAEAGAADALSQAQAQADYIVEEARQEAETLRRQAAAATAEARETRESAQRVVEEQLERAQSEARSRASAIVAEGEARARRRQAQIEGWAQEVISATQADQAQLSDEFAQVRRRHETELAELVAHRDEVVSGLRSLQATLAQAVEPVPTGG